MTTAVETASVASLIGQLPGVSHVDSETDRVNAITNAVVRCIYDGKRAVAVGADTKTQIGALLDLVSLHLDRSDVVDGTRVARDEVMFFLVRDDAGSEAEDALRTLAAQLRAPFRIHLHRLTSAGELISLPTGLHDLGDHERYRYTGWLDLLREVGDRLPRLVDRVLAGLPCEEFRAYPMLSSKGWWSLLLEGLEVAQIGPRTGWLDVGREYDGSPGRERRTWLATVPEGRLAVTDGGASVGRATEVINRFADAWWKELADDSKQNEHAFESRILRGVVPIRTSGGRLQLLGRPGTDRVSWGSQFPTRWGMTAAAGGRYLDVLLRNGSTPWALELKVDGPSGVTVYYRHAVAQAVLYREFVRQASHLGAWFEQFGLDHRACRAAVVVPEFTQEQSNWRFRLERVCAAFDVELVTVPERYARAGRLES